jgi:hypothetical protein
VLASLDAHPREDAREGEDPRRQAGAADRARQTRAAPRRELHGLRWRRVGGRGPFDQGSELAQILCARERALVDVRLKRILERHHQLDAIQRAEPELFERRVGRELGAACVLREERGEPILARMDRRTLTRAALHPLADLRAFQLARPFRARQLRLVPDQRTPHLLMIFELGIDDADHVVDHDAGIEHDDGVHALLRSDRRTDDRRVAHARCAIQHALDVRGEDVQPFGRDDHFLLAAANVDLPALRLVADVAGVEPAVLERARGLLLALK